MKQGVWFALVALLAVGCDNRSEMEEAVAYDLVDPSSAQFREVRQTDDGTWCGQVNGKNRMGAYGGYMNFVAIHTGDEFSVIIVNQNDGVVGEMRQRQFLKACRPKDFERVKELEASIAEAEAAANEVAAEFDD